MLATPAHAAPSTPGRAETDDLQHIQELIEGLGAEDAPAQAASERELSSLPLEDCGLVLDVLLYRVVPSAGSPTLSPEAEELLVERLRTWPADRVASLCLEETRGGELDLKLRGLELFGAFADARSWPELLELCRSFSPEEVVHPLVSNRLRETFHALLERDPDTHAAVEQALGSAEPWLERALVEALGLTGRGEALGLLRSLLDRDPLLDARVLKALSSWKRWDERYDDCVALVRDYLRSPSADVRLSAATALGRLGAGDAIPYLIPALDDGSSAVRRTALWSLRYVTGIEFLTSSAEWLAWYEREEEWRDERAPDLMVAASEAPVAEALPAVCELGRHPWFPDLADELVEAIHHPEPMVVEAVCGALARIGGSVSFRALLDLSEDGRPEVQRAAREGFELLAGESYTEGIAESM